MTETNEALEQKNDAVNQYLTFILGDEEYGVDILKVQEIRCWEKATTIPSTPDYVLGVINLRGIVVPIVDLRLRFSLQNSEFNATTVVVIIKVKQLNKERTVGMVVDAISDVYLVNESDEKETPDFGGSIETNFVKGLATIDEKMVILLDADSLADIGIMDVGTETVMQPEENVSESA